MADRALLSFPLLARGDRAPAPDELIRRLRADAWIEGPSPGLDLVPTSAEQVLAAIMAIADHLDTQWEPIDAVAEMDLDEIGAVFDVLIDDRRTLIAHWTASGPVTCGLDGQPTPCVALARIVWRYLRADFR